MVSGKKKLEPCTLPRERMTGVKKGVEVHTGRAMAVTIAGEQVIIMAATLPKLDIVFNYVEAKLHGGKAHMMSTLRTDACPEVVIAARSSVSLDEEL